MGAKEQHRWRENIEALTMAIVVALLFKYFVLEISKIPSGSMQPTLMGNPETSTFDRTLVDKLSYQYRDPERFEIVVFKHPLERSRVMVKRLVGMPGEDLKIEYGDLWTRPAGQGEWQHLRRPPAVQRAMWRSLETRGDKRNTWSVVRGEGWRVLPGALSARGPGAARFAASDGPITDEYRDGYPPALAARVAVRDPSWGHVPVGDVRLEGRVQAQAGTEAVGVELSEGQRLYRFRLPGPAAPADARLEIAMSDSGSSEERRETGEPLRLEADQWIPFAIENLDDRLALVLDGQERLALEVPPSARQEALLTVVVEGKGAELDRLEVLRDIYYLPPPGRGVWSATIPPGNYVMLGDNTQDSADGRLWEAVTYTWQPPEGSPEAPPVPYRGNFRRGENPIERRLDGGSRMVRFKDQWGEVSWLAYPSIVSQSMPGNEPLVPRELILGRALAVFWPLRPLEGLWRIGWLH